MERLSLGGSMSGRNSIGGAFSNSVGGASFGRESPLDDFDDFGLRLGSNPDSVPLSQYSMEHLTQDGSQRGKEDWGIDKEAEAEMAMNCILSEFQTEEQAAEGKTLVDLIEADARPTTRKNVAKMFYSCLCLTSRGDISMEQNKPYGPLTVFPSENLMAAILTA